MEKFDSMINLSKQNLISPEVIHSVEEMIDLNKYSVDTLIGMADKNKRKKIRFCSHSEVSELVQEMTIVLPKGAYVRPHKHLNKIESMMVLQGRADYVIFSEEGVVTEVSKLGDYLSGYPFYHSTRKPVYHTLVIYSDWLVFYEVTQGPFTRSETIFADWSPEENEVEQIQEFQKTIEDQINEFLYS